MKDSTAKNVHGNVVTGGNVDSTIDSIVCQGLCQKGQNQGTV